MPLQLQNPSSIPRIIRIYHPFSRLLEKEIIDILKHGMPDENKPKQYIDAHYIRSSNGNKKLLKTQEEQLYKKYGKPNYLISDRASGLNEKRKGLQKLIKLAEEEKINRIIITQKDRLTRFGFSYLEQLFKAHDVEIIVAFENEDKSLSEELMQDFMSLIASFSGKFYRLRGYEQQRKLLSDAEREINDREKRK